jgi:hypothetical protein
MKCIIAEFIQDKKKKHQATGDAYGKPQHINKRKHFLLSEIL